MGWGWRWWLVFIASAVLLTAYGSLSIQLDSANSLFLALAPKLGLALLALFLGRLALDVANRLASDFVRQPELRGTARGAASAAVWIATALLVANVFLGDISTLLIAFGLACLGVAFALQRPILCFVGWLAVISNRIYKAGDYVKIAGVEGDVISIGLLATTLRASSGGEGKAVAVPNALVLEAPVENFTQEFPYVWDELHLRIPEGMRTSQVKRIMLQACDDVIGNRKMAENVKDYLKGLKATGVTMHRSAPEVGFSIEGGAPHALLRYLVGARMRPAVKSMLSERIIEAFASPAPNGKGAKGRAAFPHAI